MKTDSQLKQDVLEELKWDASINEPGIGVAVKDGIVTLTGTVNSFAEKNAAEKATRRVAGVKAVVQDLEVSLLHDHKRTDQEIAHIALSCLRWDALVPKDSVFVKVENGWITLEGKVQWNYQREAARKAVQNISGVRGVSNKVEIKGSVAPQSVRENIRKVFERNAILDSSRINVEVKGQKVILSGDVSSWDEKRQAYHAAYSAPGVLEVENNLEIKMRAFAEMPEE